MKKTLTLLMLVLFAVPNMALARDCPVPYSEFEENIAHIDMADCPKGKPDADLGFCRLVMDGDDAYIYEFLYTDDEPCLNDINKARKSDYLMRR
jgi:hypothetical protein